jgi:hypothetical protein
MATSNKFILSTNFHKLPRKKISDNSCQFVDKMNLSTNWLILKIL